MELNINNRTALVTGASQGIGREIAIQLAKEGVCIALTSNDSAKLEQVADEITQLGGDAFFVEANAKSERDIHDVVNRVIERFGSIDMVINNVGSIGQIHSFEETNTAEWYDLFELNVMSGIHFTKAILPFMKKNSWGRIIFISSEKAIDPGSWMSPYAMTKSAILSVAKSLANEVGEYGITVNCVSPGVIITPSWEMGAMTQGLTAEAYATQFCRNVFKSEQLGQPEDVAKLVCYLCSESARWITGSNYRVDGGSVKSVQL